MTEAPFASEPVPGSVRTAPIGSAAVRRSPRVVRISQGSPVYGAAAATNFAPSSTDPPPTARIQSSFCARTTSTARISVSKSGFASTPKNSTTVRPPSAAATCACTPFERMLPPPARRRTLAPGGSSVSIEAILPRPNWMRVGLKYVKFSMAKSEILPKISISQPTLFEPQAHTFPRSVFKHDEDGEGLR
jgi:hypothetical protein